MISLQVQLVSVLQDTLPHIILHPIFYYSKNKNPGADYPHKCGLGILHDMKSFGIKFGQCQRSLNFLWYFSSSVQNFRKNPENWEMGD